jgi:hypothetical protein
MKIHFVSLLGIAVILVGCNKESPKGGPGYKETTSTTTTTNGNTVTKQTENRDETFSVKVPTGGSTVTQGKREEVTVSLNRGTNFKQAVKVSFEAPAGLKVIPASVTVKGDETKTNVLIEAAEGATVGSHSITVTGTPETGKSTSVNMDIEVKKKG